MQRKRASIDLKLTDEYGTTGLLTSPRDIRKSCSPNFRRMSFDKIGGERRSERLAGQRKSSFEFKKSPDFRRADCRFVNFILININIKKFKERNFFPS